MLLIKPYTKAQTVYYYFKSSEAFIKFIPLLIIATKRRKFYMTMEAEARGSEAVESITNFTALVTSFHVLLITLKQKSFKTLTNYRLARFACPKEVAIWRAGFFPGNQSSLKAFK